MEINEILKRGESVNGAGAAIPSELHRPQTVAQYVSVGNRCVYQKKTIAVQKRATGEAFRRMRFP